MNLIEKIRKYIQKRRNKRMELPTKETYPLIPEIEKPKMKKPEIVVEIFIEKKETKKLQRYLYNKGNNRRKMQGIPLKRYTMIQKTNRKRRER